METYSPHLTVSMPLEDNTVSASYSYSNKSSIIEAVVSHKKKAWSRNSACTLQIGHIIDCKSKPRENKLLTEKLPSRERDQEHDSFPLVTSILPISNGMRVVSEKGELPSSVGLDFRARLDGGWMVEVMKLTTDRLVNGSSCNGIDMVIKNLDLEPKIDAMMRDFLE
ncbi:hypothetical protein Tco_0865143 [Tanacetum coccineum]